MAISDETSRSAVEASTSVSTPLARTALRWWLPILFVVAVAGTALTGAGGFTFQWTCDDYAHKKSIEVERDGYNPYTSYTFAGFIVGICSPGYNHQ